MTSELPRRDRDIDFHIGTVRFNKFRSYEKLAAWKEKKNWKGCFYSISSPIPAKIRENQYLFIVEMDNDNNKIFGIGFIKNIKSKGINTGIYNDMIYNFYNYSSAYHIDREGVEKTFGKELLSSFEKLLFEGRSHYKRGKGVITISPHRFETAEKYFQMIEKLKALFPAIPFDTLETQPPIVKKKRGRPRKYPLKTLTNDGEEKTDEFE